MSSMCRGARYSNLTHGKNFENRSFFRAAELPSGLVPQRVKALIGAEEVAVSVPSGLTCTGTTVSSPEAAMTIAGAFSACAGTT